MNIQRLKERRELEVQELLRQSTELDGVELRVQLSQARKELEEMTRAN